MFNEDLIKLANAVVDANKSGALEALIADHYSPAIVSVESAENEGAPRASEGLEALKAKHDWWNINMDMHGGEVEGPFLFDPDRFAVRFTMDATNRQTGDRIQGAEIALYTVADGKIVREEFFWAVS
jgi:hypothetical protein